jgi:hypothetical protein
MFFYAAAIQGPPAGGGMVKDLAIHLRATPTEPEKGVHVQV